MFKPALALSSGTAIGLVVFAAALPILTRLYSSAEFGTYAIYTSFLSVLLVIATLRYELAIPLADDEGDARNVLGVALAAVIAISALVGVVCGAIFLVQPGWIAGDGIDAILWVLPIGLAAAGVYVTLSFWAVRAGAFPNLGKAVVAQRVSQVGLQSALGLRTAGGPGLLAGDAFGRTIAAIVLASMLHRNHGLSLTGVTVGGMRRLAGRYSRFPRYSVGGAVASVAVNQLPFILLAILFDTVVTGFFSVAAAIVSIPSVVIAAPVSQSYMREAVVAWRTSGSEFRSLYLRTLRHLAIVGSIPMVAVVIAAPTLFPVVLGDEWREAGYYARAIALGAFGAFMTQALSQALNVMERQRLQMGWDVVTLVVTTTALVAADLVGSSGYEAVLAYSVAQLFMSIVFLVALTKVVNSTPSSSPGDQP